MFKSVQYKLIFYTTVLILLVAATSITFLIRMYIFAAVGCMFVFLCLFLLNKSYRLYNLNILFLLNALENRDSAFRFPESKRPVSEREMNVVMNRIKDILAAAQKEAAENEYFLNIIVDRVSTGIVILDDRGFAHKVNQAALNMLGLPVFTHINQLRTINDEYPQMFCNLRHGNRRQITITTEREELQISLSVSEVMLKRGMMRVITMNNIGNELEIKEMESWIRLVRVMTHEIMNCIAPIVSLSDTMSFIYRSDNNAQSLRKNTVEAFETIHSTASGLMNFVESYRKFTSVPKPEKQIFDLRILTEKIVRLHEPALTEKNIAVKISIPETFPVIADENLIAQVIINLLKNAVEAIDTGSDGRIVLSVKPLDGNRICLDVANNGKPISSEVLPHIYVPFFTTKTDGSGIGLSVSRYIMRLHGGTLQNFVSPDGMTVFRIILPESF